MKPAKLSTPNGLSLVESWLTGRTETTLRSYKGDLIQFANHLGFNSPDEAIGTLLTGGHGSANEVAHLFRTKMIEENLAPATINRRLSALRSIIDLAQTFGLVTWKLNVKNVRHHSYRDTSGPKLEDIKALLKTCSGTLAGKRDRAIIRLLYDLALRRGEVVALDKIDVDVEKKAVYVVGKGSREKTPVYLSRGALKAIIAWMALNIYEPLFVSFSPCYPGARLTGEAVRLILKNRSAEAGVSVIRPHGLRHSAITAAAQKHSIPDVMGFSRHESMSTVQKYVDNINKSQRVVAKSIGAGLERK